MHSLKYHILIRYVAYLYRKYVGLLADLCGFLFGLLQPKYNKDKIFICRIVMNFCYLQKKLDIYLLNPLQFLNRASSTESTHFEKGSPCEYHDLQYTLTKSSHFKLITLYLWQPDLNSYYLYIILCVKIDISFI